MSFIDKLKGALKKDEQFKQAEKELRIQKLLEARQKNSNERELDRFMEEERQEEIKRRLDMFRKKRQQSFFKSNMFDNDNTILKEDVNILKTKNIFHTRTDMFDGHGMFFK